MGLHSIEDNLQSSIIVSSTNACHQRKNRSHGTSSGLPRQRALAMCPGDIGDAEGRKDDVVSLWSLCSSVVG